MELKQLEYFTIVCEKGSFSQAAECLYTSQPNVSKVISSLEKELGRKLVERSSRGLRITPYGETVRDYAKVILKHASLISSMATHHNGKKFTLATYPSNMITNLKRGEIRKQAKALISSRFKDGGQTGYK